MAKYFAYRKHIKTSEGEEDVYVVRPSFLTRFQKNAKPRTSYNSKTDFLVDLAEIINETIIDQRLSFFTPATSWGFYGGKFEVRHRTPVGLLERKA